jgi:hypothetical protein
MKYPKILSLVLFLNFNYINASEVLPSPINCSTTVRFGEQFIDLNCYNGKCSGEIPAQEIRKVGKCDYNVDYDSYVNISPAYVTGTCLNNFISINVYIQSVTVAGICSYEDIEIGGFNASITAPALLASGYCQANGMARIYLSGSDRLLSGTCRTN